MNNILTQNARLPEKTNKVILWVFFILVSIILFTTFVFSIQLTFPFITTKAFFFRTLIEIAAPIYVFLLITNAKLRPNFKNPLTLAVLAFLLFSFISGLLGANPVRSMWGNYERMGGVWQLLHAIFLYFYVLLLGQADKKFLRRFLGCFILVSVLTVFYGAFTYFGGHQFFPDFSLPARASSFFGNPIFFASFLILPIFLSAFFAAQSEARSWRLIYFFASLVLLAGVYISGTRGAFVGLLVGAGLGLFIYLFKQANKKIKFAGIAVIILGFALLLGMVFFHQYLPKNSVFSRFTDFNDTNTQSRILQWKTAIKGFKDKPIFGVGPENYYVISDKYFSPEFYKLDSSWFDKPHNYLLEVLATGGIFGFLAYSAIVVLGVAALYRARKLEILNWAEFAILFAGVVSYQIQNLFVFDTVTTSMAFFIFTGFLGFLQDAGREAVKEEKSLAVKYPTYSFIVLLVCCCAVFYSLLITVWSPVKISVDINYGNSIGLQKPDLALSYFEDALKQPFIFAQGDFATRYADLAAGFSLKPDLPGVSHDKMAQVVNSSFDLMHKVAYETKNNPIYWYNLTNMYMVKANFFRTELDPQAEVAAQKGVDLVPDRIQNLYYLAQIKLFSNDPKGALEILEKCVKLAPNIPDTSWWLALGYKQIGDTADAVKVSEIALSKGYQFKSIAEIQWLINFYASPEQKQYQKVLDLYKIEVSFDPNNFQLYANLAAAYAAVGDKPNAILAAQRVEQLNPAAAANVDAFIKSLK